MDDLKVRKFQKHVAEAYHFNFEATFGWAIFTVNCHTGEFQIQSDWGDFNYRWHVDHLGYSDVPVETRLKHFLCMRPDAHYVANKLTMSRQDLRSEYRDDLTEERIRQEIVKRRKAQDIDKDAASEAWWDLKHEVDFGNETALFHTITDAVYEALGMFYMHKGTKMLDAAGMSEYIQHRPSGRYMFLVEKLLPFFFDHLRKELEDTPRDGSVQLEVVAPGVGA
jgi:hypothetical protein